MKKNLSIFFFTLVSLCSGGFFNAYAQAPLSVSTPKLMDVVPGVLYITLKANQGIDFDNLSPTHTGNAKLDNLFASVGVTDIMPFDADAKNYAVSLRHGIDRMYAINFSAEGRSPRLVGHDFLALDVIGGASPRYIFQKCYTPNDPEISQQYALTKMHVLDAWGVSKGNPNIIIADLDEGVNYNHEDLKANIFKIGQYYGIDLVGDSGTFGKFKPDNDPMPGTNQSHGTFTTGCFGAVPNNDLGGSGTGFNCKIMIIKIANDSGYLYAGYEGIHYAVTHGAKILNCSWGGYETDPNYIAFIQSFIDEATDTGSLIVAAAGNDHTNTDNSQFFPACLNGVLSVGATDENDQPATFSNFGKSVHVYAPGTNIFSTTFPGNNAYSLSGGTSFSCPLTAGVAGLLWQKNPDWSPAQISRQIIQTADNVVKPADRKNYWGRVNAYSALTTPTVPGLGITDFAVDGIDSGGLNYINKKYTLRVKFKNFMAAGSGIQVLLLSQTDGLYTVQQALASLGAVNSQQEVFGSFQFTRDSLDDGAGSQLQLFFVVSYGSATVQNTLYFDTLRLNINITGDKVYIDAKVEENSSVLTLSNTYPNPVANDATISFELAKTEYSKLSICDILGRTVSVLSEGVTNAGLHSLHFDARSFPDGVYISKLETSEGAVIAKRMIVIH